MSDEIQDFISEMLGHLRLPVIEALEADLARSIREFDEVNARYPDNQSPYTPSPLMRELLLFIHGEIAEYMVQP